MGLESLNTILRWTVLILPLIAAVAGAGALITGNMISAKKDAEIASLKARHVTAEQKKELLAILSPIIKTAPVFFSPVITSGEAIQFSDEIKQVLGEAGFDVRDVDFGEKLFSLNRTGAFFWFKDKDHPPSHAKALFNAFHRVGIDFFGDPQPDFSDAERLMVVIGTHP
jgi:hypothetical protein